MTDTVRVPREPTEAMIAAVADISVPFNIHDAARAIWSAMLAASPQGEGSSADALPASRGVELAFGFGTLVVNTGTFGGDNAVFIAKATAPGTVGEYTGKSAFKRDCLQPGEHVLIFPTKEQAQAVADALVTPPPAMSADHIGEAQGWQDIATAPRDGSDALVYRPLARLTNDEPVAIRRLIGGDNYCYERTVPEGEKPCNPTDGSCHVTHWQPLPPPPSANPAPIKTSADTGDLRKRVAQIIGEAVNRRAPGQIVFSTLEDADAILDLIQSERAGSPIGQNDQPGLAFSGEGVKP